MRTSAHCSARIVAASTKRKCQTQIELIFKLQHAVYCVRSCIAFAAKEERKNGKKMCAAAQAMQNERRTQKREKEIRNECKIVTFCEVHGNRYRSALCGRWWRRRRQRIFLLPLFSFLSSTASSDYIIIMNVTGAEVELRIGAVCTVHLLAATFAIINCATTNEYSIKLKITFR